MKKHIPMAIRLILAGVILRLVYDETGVWTVVLLALLTIANEMQVALWKKANDPSAW